jgi:hypothetical protein
MICQVFLDSRHASADMDVIKVIFHKLEHCGCQRLIFHHMLYLNINIFANSQKDLSPLVKDLEPEYPEDTDPIP